MLNPTPSYRLMLNECAFSRYLLKSVDCHAVINYQETLRRGFKATHQFLEKLCNLFLQTEKPEKLALLTALERTPRWVFFVVVFFQSHMSFMAIPEL